MSHPAIIETAAASLASQGRLACRTPLLAAIAFLGCSSQDEVLPERIDLCDYELVHADEFDTLAVAPTEMGEGIRWTAHTPWKGDFGDAMFSNPRPDWPFRIDNGILKITAFRDDTGRWRSGLLAAADASGEGWGLRYGYFEARMRFPPGPGTWPAFWLMSLQPADQSPKIEIDVVEYYGHQTSRYFATGHVWYASEEEGKTTHDGTRIAVPDGSLVEDFNRYGVRVEPETITYFLNGEAVWEQPTPAEHQAPLYPLVNLALGSGYSIDETPDPSTMEVDYVRIYQPAPANHPDAQACTG